MDNNTLFIVYAAMLVATAIALTINWLNNKNESGTREWAVGSWVAVIGMSIISAGYLFPINSYNFHALDTLGNIIVWNATLIAYYGIVRFTNTSTRTIRILFALTSLSVVVILVLLMVSEESLRWRLGLGSIIVGSIYFSIIPALVSKSLYKNAENAVAFMAIIFVAVVWARGITAFGGLDVSTYPRQIDKLTVLTGIISNAGIAMGLLMMTSNRLNRRLRDMASRDSLTGLFNRRAFQDAVTPIWNSCLRNKQNMSVVILDIDNFKSINDNYGHACGDKALIDIADVITHTARNGDVVSRWGGEEFLLFMPDTKLEDSSIVAERLRKNISECNIEHNDASISVTASFGVATYVEDISSLEELISKADVMLYEAKESGRNRVCINGNKSAPYVPAYS